MKDSQFRGWLAGLLGDKTVPHNYLEMTLSYLRYPILHDSVLRLWYCFGFYPNKHILILTDSGLSRALITLYCTLLLVVVLTNTVNKIIIMDTHLFINSICSHLSLINHLKSQYFSI